ncbi:formate dehydrogenase accessory sulfurtransferase FdhD [Pseudochryseolinea flava]|uniref:Sulfur carrier protein FdhD n=1 Tax=Pseudochryseolinea flava TaxID=2059302 RepID=A0A364XW13_9BACT|nr:formate dehydrogenase accessory sulfurtransferase FdhD [Pseudochryseolinea flava]RAV98565.1 formate dehydrogenase accessory sulfurtransferase FdhD [Pseudochryseolinea flava]
MKPFVVPAKVKRLDGKRITADADLLAVEEPLEIKIGYGAADDRDQFNLAVTMRTPGNDFELAVGFLYAEGVIRKYTDIEAIHYCPTAKDEEKDNVVRVELKPAIQIDFTKLQRNFYTTSSCGVCGKSSIDAIVTQTHTVIGNHSVSDVVIKSLPEKLKKAQTIFEHTGGLHGVALFDLEGTLLSVHEDVGRHNAFDKVVGEVLIASKIRLTETIVLLSGRASFELIQKAAMAGIAVVVAIGAPSSLAVKLAQASGITLIGFVRGDKFNVYHGDVIVA